MMTLLPMSMWLLWDKCAAVGNAMQGDQKKDKERRSVLMIAISFG
jgi:hypothetical protein